MIHVEHKIPHLQMRIDQLPSGTFFECDGKLYLKISNDCDNAVDIMAGRLVILPRANMVVYYTDVDILVGNEWEKKVDEEY